MASPDKARYVEEMFSRIARRYDLLNTLISGGMHHRWKALAARTAAAGLAGPALDVATGTGDLAFALAHQPEVTQVSAVDFSEEMLRLGRRKAQKRGLGQRVDFLLANALELPFPDQSFACATTGFSLRNVTDVRRCLAEVTRVVQAGGRIVLLEMTPLPEGGLFPRLFRLYFHGFVPWMGQLIAGDREAYTYLPRSVDGFLPAEALARLMQEVGLCEVRHRSLAWGTVALHVGRRL